MHTTITHKRPLSLLEARTKANRLKTDLLPLCQPGKCVIAGSVRRAAPEVGDIELVCIPKNGEAINPGEMFPIKQNLVIHKLVEEHHRQHGLKIMKGGPRYHQIMLGTTQVDIFMTTPSQWGRILALRTGPANLSKKMAARWRQMGYEGIEGELKRKFDNEGKLEIYNPEFPTEQHFFDFLNWNYIKPENR